MYTLHIGTQPKLMTVPHIGILFACERIFFPENLLHFHWPGPYSSGAPKNDFSPNDGQFINEPIPFNGILIDDNLLTVVILKVHCVLRGGQSRGALVLCL